MMPSTKYMKCPLTLKNISSLSKTRSSTSPINKMLLMKVKNNYMKLTKKIPMSLIKNILSLKDMRISKALFQSKMSPKFLTKKLNKKPKKCWKMLKKTTKRTRKSINKKTKKLPE